MASKRHQRRRSCERKRRYETAILATEAIKGLRGLGIYRCKFGNHYHVGHGPHLERGEMKERRQQGTI